MERVMNVDTVVQPTRSAFSLEMVGSYANGEGKRMEYHLLCQAPPPPYPLHPPFFHHRHRHHMLQQLFRRTDADRVTHGIDLLDSAKTSMNASSNCTTASRVSHARTLKDTSAAYRKKWKTLTATTTTIRKRKHPEETRTSHSTRQPTIDQPQHPRQVLLRPPS
jgi:hypothetical protein